MFTHEQIAQAAQRLVEHYAWQAVDPSASVERATQRMASTSLESAPAPDLSRWCDKAASAMLYDACAPLVWAAASSAAQARLTQGYQDLGNYLTRLVRSLPAPVAGLEQADLVQETLAAVHKGY